MPGHIGHRADVARMPAARRLTTQRALRASTGRGDDRRNRRRGRREVPQLKPFLIGEDRRWYWHGHPFLSLEMDATLAPAVPLRRALFPTHQKCGRPVPNGHSHCRNKLPMLPVYLRQSSTSIEFNSRTCMMRGANILSRYWFNSHRRAPNGPHEVVGRFHGTHCGDSVSDRWFAFRVVGLVEGIFAASQNAGRAISAWQAVAESATRGIAHFSVGIGGIALAGALLAVPPARWWAIRTATVFAVGFLVYLGLAWRIAPIDHAPAWVAARRRYRGDRWHGPQRCLSSRSLAGLHQSSGSPRSSQLRS